MKRYMSILLLAAMAMAFPGRLGFSGRLADAGGTAISGTETITFHIYDTETGGSPLWSETQTVSLTGGYFDVALGELSAIESVPSGRLFVEMEIAGETLSPRQEILPTFAAHRARSTVHVDSALVSVSSSANTTGRVGHLRFIPGAGGEITESHETSATDTIYISVGGESSGTTPGTVEDAKPFIKASEGYETGNTWAEILTIDPITPGNYIMPTHMKLEGRSSYSYSTAYVRYTITYSDGSTYTSGELSTYGGSWVTLLETSIPLHAAYRGTITAISLEVRNSSADYRTYARLELSGYEIEP